MLCTTVNADPPYVSYEPRQCIEGNGALMNLVNVSKEMERFVLSVAMVKSFVKRHARSAASNILRSFEYHTNTTGKACSYNGGMGGCYAFDTCNIQ